MHETYRPEYCSDECRQIADALRRIAALEAALEVAKECIYRYGNDDLVAEIERALRGEGESGRTDD
jgi:hypothetical protein